MADEWAKALAASSRALGTRQNYERTLRLYVRPRWDDVKLSEVDHGVLPIGWRTSPATAVRVEAALSASTVKHAHRVQSLILGRAVKNGLLRANPARSLERGELPRTQPVEPPHLTVSEVMRLADAVYYLVSQRHPGKRMAPVSVEADADGVPVIPAAPVSQDGTLVRLLVFSGLRWAEAAGLRVKSVDLEARTLHVGDFRSGHRLG